MRAEHPPSWPTSARRALLCALLASGCHVPAPIVAPACPGAVLDTWVHLPLVIGGERGGEQDVVLDEVVHIVEAREDVLELRVESHDCPTSSSAPFYGAQTRAREIERLLHERGLRVPTSWVAYAPIGRAFGCSVCSCSSARGKCSVACPGDDAEVYRLARRVEFSTRARRCLPEAPSTAR